MCDKSLIDSGTVWLFGEGPGGLGLLTRTG